MSGARNIARIPLLLLFTFTAIVPGAHAAALFTRAAERAAPTNAYAAALAAAPHATLLALDADAVAAFRTANGGTIEIPTADGASVSLELEPMDLLAPGATLTYTDGAGPHPLANDLSLFKGRVAGEPDSWAVISLSANGAQGTVYSHGERFALMPVTRPRAGAPAPLHAFADEGELRSEGSAYHCGLEGDDEGRFTAPLPQGLKALTGPLSAQGLQPALPDAAQLNVNRLVFDIAVDCDYEIYANKFGSDTTAAKNYMLTVLATVSLIYERDIECTLRLNYFNLWTTSSDPYTQSTTSGELPEFASYWQANRTGVSRSIAHLVSGRPLGGGIAYLNGLCNSSFGYAVSAIDAAYSYPTNTTTWDVEVIAHEMGHNFGSPHTHSCYWSQNGYVATNATIDSCQAKEGSCGTAYSLHLPPDKGTIMSYCHLISSVATGLRLDFHPICITVMRQLAGSVACSTNPVVAPPRNPLATTGPNGVHIAWSPGGSTNVLRYDVYRSRTQLDLKPAKIGSSTGLSFDTIDLGIGYYKIRTIRAADSSAFSAEVKLNGCAFTTPGNVTVGSLPSAIARGDFNRDGVTDLAVGNFSPGTVSVALGNATAGVPNGTFTVGSTFTTGSQPAAVYAADLDLDGATDLVVGSAADFALYVHRGLKTAGVPNGTFDAGVPYALNIPVSAITMADVDEDGAPDLLVAGGGATLEILRGNLTNGLPNGTFAPAVDVNVIGGSRGIAVADFNGDGIADLAVTGSRLRILLGNGTGGKGDGTFTVSPTTYATGSTPADVAVGDFNLDGKLDVAVANSGASSLTVVLGDGTGTFGTPITVTTPAGPNGIAVGDWNSDGVPDLAFSTLNLSKVAAVVAGNGDGTFGVAQTFAAGDIPTTLALGDFNRDGGIDLAVVNRGNLSVSPLLAGCKPTLSGAIALTTPNGGETWFGGDERTIAWTKATGVQTVDLQISRDGGASWMNLAEKLSGTSYVWSVSGPFADHVRVRVVDSSRPQYADTTDAEFTIIPQSALGVGGDAAARFGILGAWPNPARGPMRVALALPQGGRGARLDVLDLAGRRVASRDLSEFAPGVHSVPLLDGGRLAPGVYLARLSRSGESHSLKVAVLQ